MDRALPNNMSYVRIWIHAVWATKYRQPVLHRDIRHTIFEHILTNGRSKGIFIDRANGYVDHAHALISLGSEQTIAKVIQLIKGESAYWINKTGITQAKFQWQDRYYAVSVSESQIETVRDYIDRQESHHQQRTFAEEYMEFALTHHLSTIE